MGVHRLVILSLLCASAACEQSTPASEDISAGDVGLETELRIGTVDGSSEYQFVGISRVEEGPNGEIVVLDAGAPSVRVYTAEGEHIRSFGRSGSGPGEFGLLMGLAVSGDTVLVMDRSQAQFLAVRVHVFSLDGNLHKTFDTPLRNETVISAASTLDGWITAGTMSFQSQLSQARTTDAPIHEFLVARHLDLNAAELGEPHLRIQGIPYYLLGDLGWIRTPLFAPKPAIAISSSGHAYVSAGGEYRIDTYAADGSKLGSIYHDVRKISVSEQDFEDALRLELEGIRSRPETGETARLVAMLENDYPRIPRAEYRPVTGRILVSPGGRLMVERLDRDQTPFVAGDGSSWDLLEVDGSIIKEIRFPASIVPLRLMDTYLYARERDELDVQYLAKLGLGI